MTDQPSPGTTSQQQPATTVLIEPRDPLVLRDARPFSAEPGARAFSLPFPLPRTLAGALRTHIGTSAGYTWTQKDATNARAIVSHGPLLVGQDVTGAWHPYVPAPRDIVFYREKKNTKPLHPMVLRPQPVDADAGEGCDLPRPPAALPPNATGYDRALHHTALHPLSVTEDVKPDTEVPRWWRLDDATAWLNDPDMTRTHMPYINSDPDKPDKKVTLRGLGELPKDTRVHVSIDSGKLTNVEGALFTTESRAFPDATSPTTGMPPLAMLCNVTTTLATTIDDGVVPLGGERRLAHITTGAAWPDARYPSSEQFKRADGIRLLLVTPALFVHGWLPDWLESGTIKGLGGQKVKVKLVGAAIDRRIPVSGWRLASRAASNGKPERKPGPRATRYAVPAGSVLFFKFSGDRPDSTARDDAAVNAIIKQIWDSLWLKPISDTSFDCDEGFGLALPGLWSWPTVGNTTGETTNGSGDH